MKIFTCFSMATFRTFHRNSMIPIITPHTQPTRSTRNTPPTCPIPSSSLTSGSEHPSSPSSTSQSNFLMIDNVDGNNVNAVLPLWTFHHLSLSFFSCPPSCSLSTDWLINERKGESKFWISYFIFGYFKISSYEMVAQFRNSLRRVAFRSVLNCSFAPWYTQWPWTP